MSSINAFSMFKVPQTPKMSTPGVQNTVTPSRGDADKPYFGDTNQQKKKKSNILKAAAIVATVAAVGAGVIYAVKTHKFDDLKNKIPFLNKSKKPNAPIDTKQLPNAPAVQTPPPAADIPKPTVAQGVNCADKGDKDTSKAGFIGLATAAGLVLGAADSINDERKGEIKQTLLDNKDYLTQEEIPLALAESAPCWNNYNDTIVHAIEKLENSVQTARNSYQKALELLDTLEDGSYVDYWEGTNFIKNDVYRDEKTGETVVTHYNINGVKSKRITADSNGTPKKIEFFDFKKDGAPTAKALYSKADDGMYLSHFIKINPKTGLVSGTLLMDKDNNVKTYLARDEQGKLRKIFHIDPNTRDVCSVALPDADGKKCTRMYHYTPDGTMERAYFTRTATLPAHEFLFDANQKATQINAYDKSVTKPVLSIPVEQ